MLEILTQVAVTKRECEIKLDEMDFDEKKKTYERKNLILQGLDPDKEERIKEKAAKKKKKLKQKQNDVKDYQHALSRDERNKLNKFKNAKVKADKNSEEFTDKNSKKHKGANLKKSKKKVKWK